MQNTNCSSPGLWRTISFLRAVSWVGATVLFARRTAVLTEGTRGRGRRVPPNGITSSRQPTRLFQMPLSELSFDRVLV